MPTVSIIILNWNGKIFLKNCLDSLLKVRYKNKEIIVVDNNSTDGSQEFVRKKYPKILLIENKKNLGFAEGNNIGFFASKGEFVLILNNDTVVTANFLDRLIADFIEDPTVGCIQPQIRLMSNKNALDGVGGFLTSSGFLYHFGYLKNINKKKYNHKQDIFSAKGACILLRRSLIDKIGLFDKDFFIFFEETDLCYRIWISGYKVLYEPESVIYHVGGGDTSSSNRYQYERRMYLSFRNMICCYAKNFGLLNSLTIFPLFVLLLFGLFLCYVFTLRFRLAIVVLRAFYWNVKSIRSTFEKRQFIQNKLRTSSDSKINSSILKNPKIGYYFALFRGSLLSYKE